VACDSRCARCPSVYKRACLWAALGSLAGIGFPATVSRTTSIPQFVVHGYHDNTVNVQRSRDMVAEFQRQGTFD